jgi:hypothetical protein
MRISDIRVLKTSQHAEISARVGAFRLVYQFPPECNLAARGDAFLAASLIPAMVQGEDLEVAPEVLVSPRLLEGIGHIQDVLRVWNPSLKKVRIQATVAPDGNTHQEAIAFFSGGVDSGYTYLKNADEITRMVLVHGLDIPLENEQLFEQVRQQTSHTVQSLGKRFMTVNCNAQDFCAAMGITMALFHGALLASVALLLECRRAYVPAASRCDHWHPSGSHALLDHHWSTEACQIVHDGAEASSLDKLKRVIQSPTLLGSLRVCDGGAAYNCGRCKKCIQTMTALRLLGAITPTLPLLTSVTPLRTLRVNDEKEFQYFKEIHSLAIESGDREVASALRTRIRRFRLRRLAKEFDEIALGGFMGGTYRLVLRPARGGHATSAKPITPAPSSRRPKGARRGTPLRPSRSAG